MIHGIGTDILHIRQLDSIFMQDDYLNDPFVRKTYTTNEIALAEARDVPALFYATRFAGKEAVFKAFRIDGNAFRLDEIEILSADTLAPYVVLHGDAARIATELGITQVHISLSYDEDYAVGYAVAYK